MSEMEICPDCLGAGGDNNTSVCSTCSGTGGVITPERTPVELLARNLWAQRADKPDRRAHTLQSFLDELGLDLVKREEPQP